jgi:predicted secreted protein
MSEENEIYYITCQLFHTKDVVVAMVSQIGMKMNQTCGNHSGHQSQHDTKNMKTFFFKFIIDPFR